MLSDFEIYILYLKKKGQHGEHPVRIPKTMDSYNKRKDKAVFEKIGRLVNSVYTLDNKQIKEFFEANAVKHKDRFSPHLLLMPDALETYKLYKNDNTIGDYYLKMQKNFNFIKEFLLERKITLHTYFYGEKQRENYITNIPFSLTHWKENKIDEALIIYTQVLDKVKDNMYVDIYAEDLIKRKKMIKARIQYDTKLSNILHEGITILKGVSNGIRRS